MSDGPDPEGRDHEPSEKRIKEALDRGDAPIAQDQTLLGALLAIYVALKVIRIVVTPERVVSIGVFFERCGDISVARGAEALRLFRTLGVGVAGGWLAIVVALASVSFVVGTLPQRPRATWRRIKVDSARLNRQSDGEKRLRLSCGRRCDGKFCEATGQWGVRRDRRGCGRHYIRRRENCVQRRRDRRVFRNSRPCDGAIRLEKKASHDATGGQGRVEAIRWRSPR